MMAAEGRGTPLLELIEVIGFSMRYSWDTSILILLYKSVFYEPLRAYHANFLTNIFSMIMGKIVPPSLLGPQGT